MIIVADIGGTKVDVAAFSESDQGLTCQLRESYFTKDHDGICEVLRVFFANLTEGAHFRAICLGMAGPVFGRRAAVTNLDWDIDADEVARVFKLKKVVLVNDMAAHAHGVITAHRKDRVVLQTGTPRAGNAAVVAVGTGLGEAILFWDDRRLIASPCEGGHASFAPQDQDEVELLEFAWKRYGHVSFERLVSGSLGFPLLVEFFLQRPDISLAQAETLKKILHNENVGGALDVAAELGDPLCGQIMRLFVRMLAGECANLALKSMAYSGVYLCGGIPPKILPWLQEPNFINAFRAKGRFGEFLAKLPVYVICDRENALRGLAHLGI